MPMELLHAIAQGSLPTTLHEPEDIDKLRVLAAAFLVEVRLPDVHAHEQVAQVLSITAEGRAALARDTPHWINLQRRTPA
jgi:hypothetical protein